MLVHTFNELDRLGRNLFTGFEQTIAAPVDIHREADRYVIQADLPGVEPDSLDVTIVGLSLTIRADRSKESTEQKKDWVVRERGSWSFVRQFTLGDDINPDGIEARYHDGVLTLAVPIVEGARRHKVQVLTGSAEHKALGGSDASIVTAVSPIAFRQAFDAMARGGTLVFVGLPAHNEVEIPIFQTVLNGITIKGSIVGTHLDLEEVFRLHAEGRTRVLRETRRLEQVNESISEVLHESTATPRLVFTF
jgi:HSP20 family molecular chaperone IbpA